MIKVILKILQWAILFVYLIVALSFTNTKRDEILSSTVSINIFGKHNFLNKELVEKLFKDLILMQLKSF
jgi:hypothetical protein